MKQKNKINISVVIPAYNSEKHISETIESILGQTYKNYELIIIDDASTDRTAKIIKKYQRIYKNIILLKNKKNLGISTTTNKGIRKARGKYIAKLDADDLSLPDRLKKQYYFLEKHKNIFLVGTGAIIINEKGDKIRNFTPLSGSDKISKTLPIRNCFYHPSIMFRNTGKYFYRPKVLYSEDYDLYLILLSDGKKMDNIKEPLIKYRINPNSVSHTKASKQLLLMQKAREFYYQRINKGYDEYDKFDPTEISKMNIEDSRDKTVLENEVLMTFRSNNFNEMRKISKIYFKNYGYFNKSMFYFIISIFGAWSINFVRKCKYKSINCYEKIVLRFKNE